MRLCSVLKSLFGGFLVKAFDLKGYHKVSWT